MKTRSKREAPPDPTGRTGELEEAFRAETGKRPEDYRPADWVSLREQNRLRLLYPGCHVAFRDHHSGEGRERRLVLREVLCASPKGKVVQNYLDQLSPDEIRGVFMEYVDEPIRKPKRRKPRHQQRS